MNKHTILPSFRFLLYDARPFLVYVQLKEEFSKLEEPCYSDKEEEDGTSSSDDNDF